MLQVGMSRTSWNEEKKHLYKSAEGWLVNIFDPWSDDFSRGEEECTPKVVQNTGRKQADKE